MEVHSASTVANVVMNALYFPDQFDSNYTVDTMTRRCAPRACAVSHRHSLAVPYTATGAG
jgi:hypothetical protein